MSKRKICAVTGTRAEYGLLRPVLDELRKDPELELQLVATGMHLSPEFGLTYKEIESDGNTIDRKVEMLLSSDTPVGIAKSMGLGVIGFAEAFDQLSPDIVLLLGDRFEILAAAQAALVAQLPIAHIFGGDTTEGAFDESIRHSITKMSHLHFVTHEEAADRVKQLGENPEHVYNVGSPGIDAILRMKLLSREDLAKDLGLTFKKKNLLITFHPSTLDEELPSTQFEELLSALSQLDDQVGLIFTRPNADTHGRALNTMIDQFVSSRPQARAYTSLGHLRYLSMIPQVDAVIGNSSSGLYEVPSFKKPTIDIGDRQKGRFKAASVIWTPCLAADISKAIQKAWTHDCSQTVNPYGEGKASATIRRVLREIKNPKRLIKKKFHGVR